MDTITLATLSYTNTNNLILDFVNTCTGFSRGFRSAIGRGWLNVFATKKYNVLLYVNQMIKLDQSTLNFSVEYVQQSWWTDPTEILVTHNKTGKKFSIIL